MTDPLPSSSSRDRLPPVPLNRTGDAVLERCMRLEPESLFRAGRIEAPARLSVRLRRIPLDDTLVSDAARNQLCKIGDADLDPAADVHRLRTVIQLRCSYDSLRGVLNVEKLARRRAVSPERHRFRAARPRLVEFPDHRRDDVARLQIEVVARSVQIHRP